MNANCWSWCGLASSSIVPTKRYNEYTKKIFRELGQDPPGDSAEDGILGSTSWPLTQQHEKLVGKTIEYAKYNEERIPKLARRLKARVLRGIQRKDVRYASAAVVILLRILEVADHPTAITFYLTYLLDVCKALIRAQHNPCFVYQGIRLLKELLNKPHFQTWHSGVINFEEVVAVGPALMDNITDAQIFLSIDGDRVRGAGKEICLLTLGNAIKCVSRILKMSARFKLGLPSEAPLLKFASKLIVTEVFLGQESATLTPLSEYEADKGVEGSVASLVDSFCTFGKDETTAKLALKHIIADFDSRDIWSEKDLLHRALFSLRESIEGAEGALVHLYSAFIEHTHFLLQSNFESAKNVIEFFTTPEFKAMYNPHVAAVKSDAFYLLFALFKQWLVLRGGVMEVRPEDAEPLCVMIMGAIRDGLIACSKDPRTEIEVMRAIEEVRVFRDTTDANLSGAMQELAEAGIRFALHENLTSFETVAKSGTSVEFEKVKVAPYECQSMLEEIVLQLSTEVTKSRYTDAASLVNALHRGRGFTAVSSAASNTGAPIPSGDALQANHNNHNGDANHDHDDGDVLGTPSTPNGKASRAQMLVKKASLRLQSPSFQFDPLFATDA